MFRTQYVLSLLLLYAWLAHSFDWDIVISRQNELQFYNVYGSLSHSEKNSSVLIVTALTYDPVHNRVLFTDINNILSFDIDSKTTDTLVRNISPVDVLAYDPISELLFWSEASSNLYSISLKPSLNSRVNEKQLIVTGRVYDLTVDICGGFIYWISADFEILKSRFDGSGRETVISSFSSDFVKIDQGLQKIYWYEKESSNDWIKYADLNGENIRQVKVRNHFFEVQLALSKDNLYLKTWQFFENNYTIWKIPKNSPCDVDVLVDSNVFIKNNASNEIIWGIAEKYSIEDVTRRVQNCERLKNLVPNDSVNNVATDESLLFVHGTKVNEESRS